MKPLALASWSFVSLALLLGCGGEANEGAGRVVDPNRNPNSTGIGPPADQGPAPQDMRGGGRGSMGPHEKGK